MDGRQADARFLTLLERTLLAEGHTLMCAHLAQGLVDAYRARDAATDWSESFDAGLVVVDLAARARIEMDRCPMCSGNVVRSAEGAGRS